MSVRTFASTHVAVVGYGYWGSKHVRVLSSLPDVAVTVVDNAENRLAEAVANYPAVRLASELGDVLDAVDAVVVATPPSTHAAVAHAALRAGRAVLVEKPMATSVADAEALIQVAADNRAVLMAGHTFEYNPAVWKLKEIVASGAIGRVLYVHTSRLSLGRYQRDCDVIWDLAPHDISIVSYLLDETPSTTRVWAHANLGTRHADVAYLQLEFERSHAHAFVNVSWLNPNKVRRVTVVGEQKMVVYDDMSDNERIRIYDIGVDHVELTDLADSHAMPVTYRTGDIISPYIAFSEPLLVQDRHFVDAVREGVPVATPGERGLDIVRVLAAADIARTTGRATAVSSPGDLVAPLQAVGS